MLICPKCKLKLVKIDNTYKCPNNHSYDIAKGGYVNLLISRTNSGDCKEMVDARNNFLNKCYYQPLALKICEILASYLYPNDYILDGGCGSGYYDSIIKLKYPNIIGFDISKDAIIKTTKNNIDLDYFVASGNNIPIEDNCISCVLNIFAPTFASESFRVLKNDGILIVVLPGEDHLIELKQSIYDNPYQNQVSVPSFDGFKIDKSFDLTFKKEIPNEDLINVSKMTPYFYKTKKESFDNLLKIDKLDMTISFKIYVYKKTNC